MLHLALSPSIASKNKGKITNKIYTHVHEIKVSNQIKLLV